MRTNYYYTINGKAYPQSLKVVNNAVREMKEKPTVIKLENFANGKTSMREIRVKGQPRYFTIL